MTPCDMWEWLACIQSTMSCTAAIYSMYTPVYIVHKTMAKNTKRHLILRKLIDDLHVQALKQALYTCMSHQGQELVQALALALLQTCPRHLLRSLAAPLRALLEDPTMSDAVKSTLSQMVCSQQYIGNAAFTCVRLICDAAWYSCSAKARF